MYKVLIVDDSKIQLESAVSFLDWESLGIKELRTAQNGLEGLEVFYTFIPDIVISDVVMPH